MRISQMFDALFAPFNAFRERARQDRELALQRAKLEAAKRTFKRRRNADGLALCQHQALMAKADRIWFAPRGKNGRSMDETLLRRHWSARGMTGQPMEVPRR